MALNITGDPTADKVLDESPFALLAGMMLDQQYPMEHAFRGPAKVLDRFGTLEPAAIAAADPEEFATLCSTPRPGRASWTPPTARPRSPRRCSARRRRRPPSRRFTRSS